MRQILAISKYSGEVLRELRVATGIDYDDLQRGILQVYTDDAGFASAAKAAALVRRYGIAREMKSAEECVAIEPALARVPVGVAVGDIVEVEIRDRRLAARVVKPPFVRNGKILVE